MSSSRQDSKVGTTDVNFLCQICHQPLIVDSSFLTVDKTLLNELKEPLSSNSDDSLCFNLLSKKNQDNSIKYSDDACIRTIPPTQTSCDADDLGNGFTLLGETDTGNMNLSLKSHVMAQLFDVMSGHSEVDHPLCEYRYIDTDDRCNVLQECTDTLLDDLDVQLKITDEECNDYSQFLASLNSRSVDKSTEESLDKELQQLNIEEQSLRQQLREVEDERKHITAMLEREMDIAKQLDEEEERYYKEYNIYKHHLLELEDNQKSVDAQLKYAQSQLDKLTKTNVFNATFHIWHNGHFGTINNFRLGRLPNVPVEWNEINAAWGQTVLLLYSLAKKTNLVFERYRLVPNGNFSYVEQLSDRSKDLPLYCTGGIRFFWDTKFDQAMLAFLDCCQQFKEAVEKKDTGFCLPYIMNKGNLEDPSIGTSYSIKIQFNSEEQWTKALKYLLTNLKWGLAWVSSQFCDT